MRNITLKIEGKADQTAQDCGQDYNFLLNIPTRQN